MLSYTKVQPTILGVSMQKHFVRVPKEKNMNSCYQKYLQIILDIHFNCIFLFCILHFSHTERHLVEKILEIKWVMRI